MRLVDEVITSKQNRAVIDAASLRDKKNRDSCGLFKFDGLKLFREAAEKGVEIVRIFVLHSRREAILNEVGCYESVLGKTVVNVVSDDVFSKLSEEQSPDGILCVAKFHGEHYKDSPSTLDAIRPQDKVIMLEAVRDPGNLGTIVRSGAAFGFNTLVLSRDCADIYNPKTLRGAMGALFKIRIFVVESISASVEYFISKGRRVYGSALDRNAKRLDDTTLEKSDIVVIGNEGHGLSEEVLRACTSSLFIPMEEGSESLNAGIAASIIMWNAYKG